MALYGWGIFLIILFVFAAAGAAGYIIYAHLRARRLGLPPPSLNPFSRNAHDSGGAGGYRTPAPAPGGIQGWISDRLSGLRGNTRSRTTTGAYESSSYGGGRGATGGAAGGRRGFGPLDPDEAWDSRVDHEVYQEDQELGGLGDGGPGPYGGGGYGVGIGGIEEGRGRSRSRQRELDARYEEEMHGGKSGGGARVGAADEHADPFGDHAEASSLNLRSVSPRPDAGPGGHRKQNSNLSVGGNEGDSPVERRSLFREDV